MNFHSGMARIRTAPQSNRIDRRELACLDRFCDGRYGVRIAEITQGLWMAEVKLEGEQRAYELQNRRGVLQVWRSLSAALAFAQRHCASAGEVVVEIRGWRLLKLDEFIHE